MLEFVKMYSEFKIVRRVFLAFVKMTFLNEKGAYKAVGTSSVKFPEISYYMRALNRKFCNGSG